MGTLSQNSLAETQPEGTPRTDLYLCFVLIQSLLGFQPEQEGRGKETPTVLFGLNEPFQSGFGPASSP
jgi:hypothetical protein